MNTIACLSWVKKGVSKRHPDTVRLGDEELAQLVTQTPGTGDSEEDEENEQKDHRQEADSDKDDAHSEDNISKKYKLDEYSDDEVDNDEATAEDEDEDDDEEGTDDDDEEETDDDEDDDPDEDDDDEKLFPHQAASTSKHNKDGLSMAGLSHHSSNKQDPYITEHTDSSDEESEILPDDNLLAVGKVTGDFNGLEVYVYNENSSSLYCHHDTILGSFPLAMEWIGYDPGFDPAEPRSGTGNLLAVGSMEPHIDLWDIDLVDCLEPEFVLQAAYKKVGKKKKKLSGSGHTDAVLALAWNPLQQNVLASGSADFTVGLWDLDEGKMATLIKQHSEKVQALAWHPFESQTLLSGSFDNTVKVFDCRSPDDAHKTWTVRGEVEHVTWNSHDPYYFLIGTDSGRVYCMDVRAEKPLYKIKAHEGPVTGLAVSTEMAGCLVTSSSDKLVKVWDICDTKPELVYSRDYKVGELHCMRASPDSGYVFALGGEHELKVIHLKTSEEVMERFNPTEQTTDTEKDAEIDSEMEEKSQKLTETKLHMQKEKKKIKSKDKLKPEKSKKKNKEINTTDKTSIKSETDAIVTDIKKKNKKKKKLKQTGE